MTFVLHVPGNAAQFVDQGRLTWSAGVAPDFVLTFRQLHGQAKVGDTDVACESKQEPKVTDTNVFVLDKLEWRGGDSG